MTKDKKYYTWKGVKKLAHILIMFIVGQPLIAQQFTEVLTEETLSKILFKAEFWKSHFATILNYRKQKVINELLDGFDG